MTLDDRSLREHLDRRAESGVTDVERIAEVVMSRVAVTGRGGWWRGLGGRGPSLGAAAAAIVVVVVALAVMSPGIWPGPGTSTTPSGTAPVADYPATRALTIDELDAFLGFDPTARAGEIVIAYVTLKTLDIACYGTDCPRYLANLEGRKVSVHDPDEAEPELPGPSVLRIRSDGDLDLLGHVRAGPDGLAWAVPQLTAELPDLRGPGARPVPYLYLVDAIRVVSSAAIPCPPPGAPLPAPDFSCGPGIGWLVPDEASIPDDPLATPTNGLRLPNGPAATERGYWLVDPFVTVDVCFMCSIAGAVDLVGRVLALQELGVTRQTPKPTSTTGAPTPSPTASQSAVVEVGFSTGSMALDGFETADVTVSIEFTGPVQPDPGADPSLAPLIYLERDAGDTGDPSDPHIAQLVRAMSPTPVAGQWTATFRLTSGDRGTWRVGGIVAYDIEGNEVDIDPAIGESSPTLEIIGTHAPHLTMERKPTPAPAEIEVTLQIFGRVTDEDTGDPLGDVVVTVGQGDACAPGGTGATVTTDPNGWYKHVIPEAGGTVVCAWVSDEPGVYPSFDAAVPIALYAALFAEPTNP